MYPGGAMIKVYQFAMKENIDGYPRYWPIDEPKYREESPCVPLWFEDRSRGYVRGVQGGLIGPVVSYYERVDSINRSFW